MLIMPPFSQTRQAMKRCLFPLGLGYLAAVLEEAGHDVMAVDCIAEGYDTVRDDGSELTFGLSDEEIRRRVQYFKPDFVGISVLISRQVWNAYRVCKIVKEVDLKIETIVGGCHPSALPESMHHNLDVDYVVVGAGEAAILRIVDGHESGIVQTPEIPVATIPWPARHLFPMERYFEINMPTSVFSPHRRVAQIEMTRSCPFDCCFCSTTQFRGKYQTRPVGDCLQEVQFLKEKYDIDELDIIDSNLIVNRKWTMRLLKGLKDIGVAWSNAGGIWVGGLDEEMLVLMKESGCYQLSLAIESSTPRILNEVINKPLKLEMVKPVVAVCKKIGIDLHAFFVCGFPEQSKEEILNDYSFAKEMGFTSASFNIICPLPGSRIYDKYKGSLSFDAVDLRKSSIPHPELGRREMERLVAGMNRRFNASLIFRNPIMFVKKYVATILRKPSLGLIKRIFNRQ